MTKKYRPYGQSHIVSSVVRRFCFVLLLLFPLSAWGDLTGGKRFPVVFSDETQDCLDCHEVDSPGIVADWLTSRHAKVNPRMALKKEDLERRVSSKQIPEPLQDVAVGCYECHTLNSSDHDDNFIHNGYRINIVVSPNDCATCHEVEAEQYSHSKKAHALDILQKNPLFLSLVDSVGGIQELTAAGVVKHKASETTKGKTCYACHGTTVAVMGTKVIETANGETVVPNLTNWPNQGVGRINPDGSKGACTSCHPRHSFSVEIARKPYTCSQCHLAPDVPAWEVYKESKHGNIFFSKQHDWNWNSMPWTMGKDFRAPTCAVCHNALLTNSNGEVVAQRTHDFGSRLWTRLFGLIYSHPQPKDGKTYLIVNNDGLPLPTSLSGELADDYLISSDEQEQRQNQMKTICRSCHSSNWIEGHFQQLDNTIAETDRMVYTATQLMQVAWDRGVADPSSLFDEGIEKKWMAQWLFYANSVRYGAAMGGPDYSAFKYGWWDLSRNIQELKETIESTSGEAVK